MNSSSSEDFGIKVDDGTEFLTDYAMEQNEKVILLHDWQRRAIEYFSKNNHAIFEVVTGAGKTFMAIEIIKRVMKDIPELKVLIVVPKNVIMERGWYKELVDAGISIPDIGIYYGNIKEISKITLTNMQNLDNIDLNQFHMGIFDECHNYGTKRMLKLLNHPFDFKIGLSATLTDELKTYKIMEAFKNNVFKYTPGEALQDDVINQFNFVNIGIEMDEDTAEKYESLTQQINFLLQMGGGYNKIMRDGGGPKYKFLSLTTERKKLVNNYNRKFEVVKKICKKHDGDKIIVFNEFNEITNQMYWHLLDEDVRGCIIHSGIEREKREQNLNDVKTGKHNVIISTRVLDEGYNLPKLDTAIIASGQATPRQTIQRLGRVLRKKDTPSVLYQLYVIGTIEQDQAEERNRLFKELCTEYNEYFYMVFDNEFTI